MYTASASHYPYARLTDTDIILVSPTIFSRKNNSSTDYSSPLSRRALQKKVVVGVLEVRLHQVVVNILCRYFGFYLRQAESFELQHHHGTGGALAQGLVDLQLYRFASLHTTTEQMPHDQLRCQFFP